MISLNKSINYYFLAACTCLSYLGLQSQTKAQISTKPVASNEITEGTLQAPFQIQQETPNSKPVLEYTSRAELIRNLKRRIASKPDTSTQLINRLKGAANNRILQESNQEIQEANVDLLSSPTIATGTQETFPIKDVQILGSTVFKKSEIAEIVKPYIGKQARFEELLAIRSAVTDYYTKRGYTTSGAFLPPQDVSSGVVNVQVVEGELERVEIQGLRRLRPSYVRDRIRLGAGAPINLRRLETALQLLQVDPLFTSVQAELKAGTTPGRSILALNLREARPITTSFTVENRDSPSVGSVRGTSSLSYQNLLGFGDRFTAQVGYTSGANSYDLGYSFPINARDGSISFRYADGNSKIIEEPFSPLDILGRTKTFSLGYRQPLVNTPSSEFTLGFSADLRESQTYLLKDIPFSFSTGPEDGNSKVTVLRFSQDWINRTPSRVFAARSQFSLGIGALGATVNDTGVDGRFISWIGQFQWVQNLGRNFIGVARVATQLTPDSLLPLEQFSIGGVDTIRGYRQNQFVADNGITSSFELRIPVVNQPGGFGNIQVAPFVDVGKVWNNSGQGVDTSIFASTGLGLRWQIGGFVTRLDWGLPLTSISRQGNSLQDNGLFFSLMYQP